MFSILLSVLRRLLIVLAILGLTSTIMAWRQHEPDVARDSAGHLIERNFQTDDAG